MPSAVSVSLVELKLGVVDFVSELDEVSGSSLDPGGLWNGLEERDIDFVEVVGVDDGYHVGWLDEGKTEGGLHHLTSLSNLPLSSPLAARTYNTRNESKADSEWGRYDTRVSLYRVSFWHVRGRISWLPLCPACLPAGSPVLG